MKNYFIGRGFLHPEKLKIAEKYRGKPLVDAEGATEHKGVLEIRLCPYMYWCTIQGGRCLTEGIIRCHSTVKGF